MAKIARCTGGTEAPWAKIMYYLAYMESGLHYSDE